MPDAVAAPLERAHKLAGGAATVAVIAAIIIAIGSVADVVAPGLRELRAGEVTPDWAGALNLFRAVGASIVLALPGFLLAGALFELSRVLDEYGKGQFFTLRASKGVRKAGEDALWALAFKILISPTLYTWITHEGRGFIWQMEPFDLGLVAFAAFVMVLGRVLEAAARIKEEHDQIV
jgi:hypothetical protein